MWYTKLSVVYNSRSLDIPWLSFKWYSSLICKKSFDSEFTTAYGWMNKWVEIAQ